MWVDECSKLFGGGLDIMCVEAIVGKDNKEFIIEVLKNSNKRTQKSLHEDIVELINNDWDQLCFGLNHFNIPRFNTVRYEKYSLHYVGPNYKSR